MQRQKIDGVLLCLWIISYLAVAAAFLLMLTEISKLITAIIFYSGLLFAVALQIILSVRRKAWLRENNTWHEKELFKGPGIIKFARNQYAFVADALLIVSLIAFVACMIATKGVGDICFMLIAAVVFTFSFHCILNGKIYFYVQNQDKFIK